MSGKVAWRMYDPTTDELYTFQQNPSAMTSGALRRSFSSSSGMDGKMRVVAEVAPIDWEFSGNLRTQAQHDALIDWSRRPRPIIIRDHFGTLRVCIPLSFAPQDKRSGTNPWLHSYTFKARIIPAASLSTVEQGWIAEAVAAFAA